MKTELLTELNTTVLVRDRQVEGVTTTANVAISALLEGCANLPPLLLTELNTTVLVRDRQVEGVTTTANVAISALLEGCANLPPLLLTELNTTVPLRDRQVEGVTTTANVAISALLEGCANLPPLLSMVIVVYYYLYLCCSHSHARTGAVFRKCRWTVVSSFFAHSANFARLCGMSLHPGYCVIVEYTASQQSVMPFHCESLLQLNTLSKNVRFTSVCCTVCQPPMCQYGR